MTDRITEAYEDRIEQLEFEGTAFGGTFWDPAKQKFDWEPIPHPTLCRGSLGLRCYNRAPKDDDRCDGCKEAQREFDQNYDDRKKWEERRMDIERD